MFIWTCNISLNDASGMLEYLPRALSNLNQIDNIAPRVSEIYCGVMCTTFAVGIRGREVVETVFEDTVENASERTSSMFGDAHHILDGQLPTEREWDLEEMMCSISGAVEERRMDKNISRENTPVISEDDIDRDNNSCPVIVHECEC